jgi:hypothetical protein
MTMVLVQNVLPIPHTLCSDLPPHFNYLVTWNLKILSLHDFMPMSETFYATTQQQMQ